MLECDVWDCSLVTSLETMGARCSFVLTRERRVVRVTRRVWPSRQMMEAKGEVETLDELEAWRTGRVVDSEGE
jgi:hypothetical protein